MSDDENTWDGWEEEDLELVRCLFSDKTFTSTKLALNYAKTEFGFDFALTRTQLALDFYGCMKLINFIRTHTQQGTAPAAIVAAITEDRSWVQDEKYLKPVLPDDGLLFSLDDTDDEFSDDEEEQKGQGQQQQGQQQQAGSSQAEAENLALRAQVSEMSAMIQKMRGAMAVVTDAPANGPAAGKDEGGEKDDDERTSLQANPHDSGYFESYSRRNIHETMLKDKHRTESYRDFMYQNPEVFKDKVVLDIGCGTGILSMFAAKAGAKQVIGIDAADIIDKAAVIVKANQLDHIITLVKSKVEEATIPVDKVDLIISEWMGYFLLYESMLPSVLFARDKWCVPGGGVYPNKASMYIAGADLTAKKVKQTGFWADVYGFDMSSLVDSSEEMPATVVDEVVQTDITTQSQEIKSLDMMTCKEADLEFKTDFELAVGVDRPTTALVVWFDTTFDHGCTKPVVLNTAPTTEGTPLTHWFQTSFHLHVPINTKKGDIITGTIEATRHKDCDRDYNVSLKYCLKGASGEQTYLQQFRV